MFQVLNFEPKTLIWWYTKRDDIDFSPKYQRRSGRWSLYDQAYLVNSIINGFDIPKFYITDFTFLNTKLNTAGKSYAVIDGKQRLEAVFSFLNGNLRLSKDFIYYKDGSIELSGMSYYDLKQKFPTIASDIDNFSLSVMRVITDDEGMINELFLRLNRSQQLTGAEVRNAMGGAIVSCIRAIAENGFFEKKISFNVKKGEGLNLAAKLLIIEVRNGFVDIKKINLDKFVEEGLKFEISDYSSYVDKINNVLDKMCRVFQDKDRLLRSQGDVPVYYWLARNYSEDVYRVYRFLMTFDEEKKKVRRESGLSPERRVFLDDVMQYDYMRRSTNDQSSLRFRYSVLEKYMLQGIPS